MDETVLRLALIGSAAAVAAIAATALRRRRRTKGRPVAAGLLAPGVYLFTSSSCGDCETARRLLVTDRGEDGFIELSWESRPEVFAHLGVDQVPSTLVVGPEGRGRLYPGAPRRARRTVDP